ncbi:MAG: N-6 DNA methylase [Chloroflexi bacterium]|nr:N-6 DNA methylase [Chloroflexota bacterium]
MADSAEHIRRLLLRQAGFVSESDRLNTGLVDAQSAHNDVDSYLRYAGLFQQIESTSQSPDLIYQSSTPDETPAIPCGYIKVISHPSPQLIAKLRAQIWNHGRLPTLWVITTDSVRVYDSFARPHEQDRHDSNQHLLGELRLIGDRLDNIHNFHRRQLDTGVFWQLGPGSHIDPRQRVDQSLLRDLRATENLLNVDCSDPAIVHSLLASVIFVKYLEDRKILRRKHFAKCGDANCLRDVLRDKRTTVKFFAWLHSNFNGDLFPQHRTAWRSVQSRDLKILRRFLSGDEMESYPHTQSRLWPYSFDFVPIELISSIYEMFAHSIDPATASARSVHYTRFGLVDLMLSLAMRNIDKVHHARVLDPACGSGVFLVEAFRRLAWAKSNRLQRRLTRSELKRLLRSQIFGIDVDREAVYVAAFSLYLALLELDPKPFPIHSLTLPNLLGDPSSRSSPNLYVQDFLNTQHKFNTTRPFVNRGFDLIISNPPWTKLTEDTAPRDPDAPEDGIQWGLRYVAKHRIPGRKPDQAFMWRARDFASTTTKVAMVVGSRLFHQASTTGRPWRQRFLESTTIHVIVDLSDLVNEKLLFGGESSTRLPASVIVFSPRNQDENLSFHHLAPKWYPAIRTRDEIVVHSTDIKELPQSLVRQTRFKWKAALRGSLRDIRFLYRLSELETLDDVLDSIGIIAGRQRGRGITIGGGKRKDASRFRGMPFLDGKAPRQHYLLDVSRLPRFSLATVAQRSNQLTFGLPALIVSRSLLNNRPCVRLALPTESVSRLAVAQSYYAISFPPSQLWLAQRFNALLNSEFAFYWTFMTAPELGVGRRLIEVSDWCSLPVPLTIIQSDSTEWAQAVAYEHALRTSDPTHPAVQKAQSDLNSAIYDLYDLSRQDIILAQDSVTYTVDRYLKRRTSPPVSAPSPPHLVRYAQRVCSQLNDLLKYSDRKLDATICTFSSNVGLAACRFTLRAIGAAHQIEQAHLNAVDDFLNRISEHLRARVSESLYIQRDLRVYDHDGFWIIKPSDDTSWTESAALGDADRVVDEHLWN